MKYIRKEGSPTCDVFFPLILKFQDSWAMFSDDVELGSVNPSTTHDIRSREEGETVAWFSRVVIKTFDAPRRGVS